MKYCVKIRFHSDLYTQPEWVPVSWHKKIEDAERALAWQKDHGALYLETKILPA